MSESKYGIHVTRSDLNGKNSTACMCLRMAKYNHLKIIAQLQSITLIYQLPWKHQ